MRDNKTDHRDNRFAVGAVSRFIPRCSPLPLKVAVMGLALAFVLLGILFLTCAHFLAAFMILLGLGLWRMTNWARLGSILILLLFVVGIFNPLTASDLMIRGNVENTLFLLFLLALSEGLFLLVILLLRRHKDQFRSHLI